MMRLQYVCMFRCDAYMHRYICSCEHDVIMSSMYRCVCIYVYVFNLFACVCIYIHIQITNKHAILCVTHTSLQNNVNMTLTSLDLCIIMLYLCIEVCKYWFGRDSSVFRSLIPGNNSENQEHTQRCGHKKFLSRCFYFICFKCSKYSLHFKYCALIHCEQTEERGSIHQPQASQRPAMGVRSSWQL